MIAIAGKRAFEGFAEVERPIKRVRTELPLFESSPVEVETPEFEDEMPEVENLQFVQTLADILEERMVSAKVTGREKADLPAGSPLGVFYSTRKQSFSLAFYMRRLVEYTKCSKSAFTVMLIYMERVLAAEPELQLSEYNVHRLSITALMLAVKYLEDIVHTNTYYAKVGGVASLKEMNALEASMLATLKFSLFVDPAVHEEYTNALFKEL